jgi:hypothetical protein
MVANIIETIVDVITGLLSGIGQAVVTYFQTLVLVESNTPGVYTDALNEFGIFLFVLLGIGAAFGLASLIFNLVRNRA